MATFNTRQLNVQQLCILYNWCAAVMATRVLCIVAMETVTVQIQYLRRCSWSHKVATPSLVNLHVHINHTAVHLHLNLKRSRITTYYTTTPNMCLLWYFTMILWEWARSECTKALITNMKSKTCCHFKSMRLSDRGTSFYTQRGSLNLTHLKQPISTKAKGSPLLTQAF